MMNYKDKVLSYTEEFTKKYGYTPTAYQIADELFLPYDKAVSIFDMLRAEGQIKIHRPLI